MLETLAAFHARVDGFQHDSLPHEGPLTTKPLLVEKVAPDGGLRPFFGNTMIFDLPQSVQLTIARMQLMLHHRCGWMLAEPLTPDTLQLLLDCDSTGGKVHTIPCEAQYFTLTHAGEQSNHIDRFKLMPLCSIEELFYILAVEGLYLCFFHTRELASISGVSLQITDLDGLLQSLVQNSVGVFDSFWRQGLFTFQQAVIKALYLMGRKGRELNRTQSGLDVRSDSGLVAVLCAGLHVSQVLSFPYIKPRPQSELGRLRIAVIIDGHGGGLHLLSDFLLCLAAETALDLLACAGVTAYSDAGLPVYIILSVAPDNFLPDSAAALCSSFSHNLPSILCLMPCAWGFFYCRT